MASQASININKMFFFPVDLKSDSLHSEDLTTQKIFEIALPILAGKTMGRESLMAILHQVVQENNLSLPVDDPECGIERLHFYNGVIKTLAQW